MKLFQRGPAEVEPEESKREVPDGSQRLDLQRTFKLPQPKKKGYYPAVFEMPATRARNMLALLLSCWKWTSGLRNCPDYCDICDCEMSSEHVMFQCETTRIVRENFAARTGMQFRLEIFHEDNIGTEIADACGEIIAVIRDRVSSPN
jgi:hypothetical protein